MISARVVSNATVKFFNDINMHSSRVMKIVEETQKERSHQVTNFEMKFKVRKHCLSYLNPKRSNSCLVIDFLPSTLNRKRLREMRRRP
jgi:hypothetical protein